jgi:hypothetical protein
MADGAGLQAGRHPATTTTFGESFTMILRATAHPAFISQATCPNFPAADAIAFPHSPRQRPQRGIAPLVPAPGAWAGDDLDADDSHPSDDHHPTRWGGLDDEVMALDADSEHIDRDCARADAELLRCVACAAFATLVLALVSSLQLG